jgi:serine/threonine protein kinase
MAPRLLPMIALTIMKPLRDEATLPSTAPPKGEPLACHPFVPGRLVDDKFMILSSIDGGGMAHLMLAHDVVLDRQVAIKLLKKELLADPEWRGRFVAEAKNMARVQHENVMQIHSFGVASGWPYFVMDYVPGGDLAEWRRLNRSPDPVLVAGFVRQIASGLDAIHAAGLVHHDVKPSNVLLTREGRVLLTDLGLSRLVTGRKGSIQAGTPRYMAPEQLSDVVIDPALLARADIYQLGVTALHLLIGIRDLDAATVVNGLCSSLPAMLVPSDVRPSLSHALDEVIAIATAWDPRDRYESAGAFAEALANAVAPVSATLEFSMEPVRMLIADDDEGHLEICHRVLMRALPPGSSVVGVGDGELALQALLDSTFDVVLLDLHMPGKSGDEVASTIAAAPLPHPRVLVMTAAGGSEDWRVLRPHGVEALLLKPLDAGQLVAAVLSGPVGRRFERSNC